MPSSHKKTVGTLGNVILIEEYRPLAIAFGSAVKKYAGAYETRVVASLKDADKAMLRSPPALLVLDFDPPPRGAVDFFQRLQTSFPNARVLILAAEEAPDFSEVRPGPPAFHFIQKPFDLAKFGEEIGRLLRTEEGGGKIGDLGLVDFVVLYAVSAASLVLKIESGSERTGEIHFAEGRIVHASIGSTGGIEAFQKIMRWPKPRFHEAERYADAPRSLQTAWAPMLTEVLRAAQEEPAPDETGEIYPEPAPLPTETKTSRGKKIVIVDDTDLISVFVAESLMAADSTLEITAASSGLEGLERVASEKADLVLLDYSLPDVKGDEVARRLLENPQTAAIPIIMMSGHLVEMAATAERFKNVVATIGKPFLATVLVDLVMQALASPSKIREPRPKKIANKPETIPKAEPHVVAAKKARNGKRLAPKTALPAIELIEIAPPETIPEEIEQVVEAKTAAEDPVTEEERLFFNPPPAPSPPEIQDTGIPAAITAAKSNAVILGIPLQVIALKFSSNFRIQEIRARPFSAAVSMRVLPPVTSGIPISDAIFELAQVSLKSAAQIDSVRLAPPAVPLTKFSNYPAAIDGMSISPATSADSIEMIPTAVAPMRLQLLSLFELSSVELSPEFRVAHLVLKSRGEKARITLQPEMAQTGATFEVVAAELTPSFGLDQILLRAVPA